MVEESRRTTRDLALASFVHMKGLEIVKAVRKNGGKFEFMFRDPESKFDELAYGFANSECHKFDGAMRSLKKLCNRKF